MFGNGGKLLYSPVHHGMKAVRQMVPVSPVNGYTLEAFSVQLAGGRAGAVVHCGLSDFGKESVLKPFAFFPFAFFE